MLEIRPFKFDDAEKIDIQPEHAEGRALIVKYKDELKPLMEDTGLTLVKNGAPVACGGITNGVAWALLAKDLRYGEMIVLHRIALMYLQSYNYRAVAEIDGKYQPAVRWAKMLGFEPDDTDWEGKFSWWSYTTRLQ